MSIAENYQRIRSEIPDHVTLLVAAKTRSANEVAAVIRAGATHIGENYVQELEAVYKGVAELHAKVNWHIIGHLQTNKINKALKYCDMIQSVSSFKKAKAIDKRVPKAGKEILPVLLEINIAAEKSKYGVAPDYQTIEDLVVRIARLEHLRLEGLMTMGPYRENPEHMRPYFKKMKELYDQLLKTDIPHTEIKTLSMGMSHSYRVAIEEGSNLIRIGSAIFGPRESA